MSAIHRLLWRKDARALIDIIYLILSKSKLRCSYKQYLTSQIWSRHRILRPNTMLYRVALKFGTLLYALQIHQLLTNFQTVLTVRIIRKYVIILSLKISPHLKCVATLPVVNFLKCVVTEVLFSIVALRLTFHKVV